MGISVLLCVRNGKPYVVAAIESILNQSFSDFELVIRDDGSTDGTSDLIQSFHDPRITVSRNDQPKGLAKNLNEMTRDVRAPYIARMDADDVAEPQRLEQQLTYLKTHPDIDIIGTQAVRMNGDGKISGPYDVPQTHGGIKWRALFANPLVHPSLLIRTDILQKHPYNETYSNSQDYELWSRLLFETDTRFANLPTPLLRYRVHGASTTQTRSDAKKQVSLETSLKNIKRYTTPNTETLVAYAAFRMGRPLTLLDARRILRLFDDLRTAFFVKEHLTKKERNEVIALYLRNKRSVYRYLIKQLLRKLQIFH
jgi:glycosyltransferase involved in cell wall biosynthesis